MDTTVSIRLSSATDIERVISFLTQFGQVQVAKAGDCVVKVYAPIDTQEEVYKDSATTTSRVYEVSRAQVNAICSDSLNPWDFFLNQERDRVLVLISNL